MVLLHTVAASDEETRRLKMTLAAVEVNHHLFREALNLLRGSTSIPSVLLPSKNDFDYFKPKMNANR